MFLPKRLFPGSRRVAGIDIGSSALKLVEIKDTPKGWTLQRLAQIPIERGVIQNGLIKDPDALARRIKDLVKVSRYRGKYLTTALSGHVVMINKAGFRKMEEEELRDVIVDEAGEYFPFDDIRDVNFDFHICSEESSDPNQMDVIIAAVKKEITESYTAAIEKAGSRVTVMDVDSFALETAYEENYDFEADDIIALVNIGASITNINIVRNAESVFTRNIMVGGDSITETLKEELGLSFEEAEMVKLEGRGGDDETGVAVLDYLTPLFLEIGRSFDYFSSTASGSPLSGILLSGGCAVIPGIVNAMKDRFHCEVEIFNPFKNILYNKNVFSASYLREVGATATVGVGLALRRVEES